MSEEAKQQWDDSEIAAIHAHVARVERDIEMVLHLLPYMVGIIVGGVLLGVLLMEVADSVPLPKVGPA